VSIPRPLRTPVRPGIVIIALLLCAACTSPPPPEELTLRVGYPDIPSTLLLYVAQDAKLFAAEHLRVEARVYATGREALAAALSGETDAAVVYSTPVVIAALSGEDVVVLTTLHRADGLTGLAVAPGTGIQSAADLRGHRIGITPGTSSQLALDVLLAEGGLDARDIQVVAAQPKDLIDALADRRIDAASLWVPNLLSVTGPGKAQLLTSDVYSEMSMLAGVRPRIEGAPRPPGFSAPCSGPRR
jgi:NitT/TauT family transport system substrate-binding protein